MSGPGQQHNFPSRSDDEAFHHQQRQQQFQAYSQPPYRESDHSYGGGGGGSPPPPPVHMNHPAAHPGSSFAQLQAQRQGYGVAPRGSPPTQSYDRQSPPAQHFEQRSPPPSYPAARRESFTTPGADNLGGRVIGVADTNERDSGLQAVRGVENWGRAPAGGDGLSGAAPAQRVSPPLVSPPLVSPPHMPPPDRCYSDDPRGGNFSPELSPPMPIGGGSRGMLHPQQSYGSTAPLAGAVFGPGMAGGTDSAPQSLRSLQLESRPNSFYADSPYNQYSSSANNLAGMEHIDPINIADDGDDGLGARHNPHAANRKSLLGMHGHSRTSSNEKVIVGAGGAAAVGAGAGAGAGAGIFGRDASGSYNAVPGGSGGAMQGGASEKAAWAAKEKKKRKWRWIGALAIIVLVVGAIVGGTVGGLVMRNRGKNTANTSAENTEEDLRVNGDLDSGSDDIKALLDDENLHRVFPGIDYTPMNAQYPECMLAPPSQNNVTRDVAILSQLTKVIRLYGTDCNQTQMVLHALDRLELTDMKVWLGVHLDSNATTNERQLAQAWDILDSTPADRFKGVVVGNEVLFRKDLTEAELASVLAEVKQNLTDRDIDLPLATADLGDNWTRQLATEVDVVMANIHPFFAGVTADKAAAWTYDFWRNRDLPVTEGLQGKTHVISEVGWPSAGGNKCGVGEPCPDDSAGSVAGIDEMNTFMDTFVCDSLDKGTEYFWFEALDEPWKVRFNTKDEAWEDKWGLLTADRVLKDGVKIPDCGGKTV